MGKPRGNQELRTILAARHYRSRNAFMVWWFYHHFFLSCLLSGVSWELCSSSPPPQLRRLHCPLWSLILLLFFLYWDNFRPTAPWGEQRRDMTLALPLLGLTSIHFHLSSPARWTPFAHAMVQGQRGGIFLRWHWRSAEVQPLALWHLVKCVDLLLFCGLYLICLLISFYGCSLWKFLTFASDLLMSH